MEVIVVKEVGKAAETREVEQLNLKTMQELVGGWIQIVTIQIAPQMYLDLVLDEEGKLKDYPVNFVFPVEVGTMPGDTANGTVFFCASNEDGETIGLTEDQVEAARAWFNYAAPLPA